jgi:predicted regulator of Ras-like GTPase activity (Roadblock/LC7/MglB family)
MVATTHLQYSALADVLKNLVSQGEFTIAVLTDKNGLPLASSDGDQMASEAQSAVVAQVQSVVIRVLGHLSMAAPDEISFNDVNGRKLVCRQFVVNNNEVVYLAVLIPSRLKSHRKLMNQAIHTIEKIWNI